MRRRLLIHKGVRKDAQGDTGGHGEHDRPIQHEAYHGPEREQGDGDEDERAHLQRETCLLQAPVDPDGEIEVRKNLVQDRNIAQGLAFQDRRKNLPESVLQSQTGEASLDLLLFVLVPQNEIPADHDDQDHEEDKQRNQDHVPSPMFTSGARRSRSEGESPQPGSYRGISAECRWPGISR